MLVVIPISMSNNFGLTFDRSIQQNYHSFQKLVPFHSMFTDRFSSQNKRNLHVFDILNIRIWIDLVYDLT